MNDNVMPEHRTRYKTRANIAPWLMWALAVIYYSVQIMVRVSPAVMVDELMHDFAVHASTIGAISSFYLYSYSFLQIPMGVFLDAYGARHVFFASMLVFVAGVVIFAHAHHAYYAYLGRFLIGAGGAVGFIGTSYIIRQWFSASRTSMLLSLTMIVATFGAINAGAPLAVLMEYLGWRQSLDVLAGVSILLLIVMVKYFQDSPTFHANKALRSEGVWDGFKHVIRLPMLWWLGICGFGMYLPLNVFADLWGINYVMKIYGVSHMQASGVVSVIYFGLFVGCPLASMLAKYINSYRQVIYYSSIAIVCILFLIWFLPHISVTSLTVLMFLLGLVIGGEILCFVMAAVEVDTKYAGITVGLVNAIIMGGGAIFQYIFGMVLDVLWTGGVLDGVRQYFADDYRTAFLCLIAAAIVAVISAYMLPKHKIKTTS